MIEMTTYTRQLSVPPDDVDAVHKFLQTIWEENPHVPARDKDSLETAVIELATNIIQYSVAVSGVTCKIVIQTSDDRIDVTIADNGELIALELDEHIIPDAFSESGRGIALVKALVDGFSFDTSGNKNEWRLSKRIQQ